jgi:hypothetical protein
LQIDNDPCPGLDRVTTESARGCNSRETCKDKVDEFYTFEKHGADLFKRDHKKSRELKERQERQERDKREQEERERKLRERQEADALYHENRRKKKMKMKKEKIEAQEEGLL